MDSAMLVRSYSADRHDLQADAPDAVQPEAVAPRPQAGLRLGAQLLRLADVVAEHVPKGSPG